MKLFTEKVKRRQNGQSNIFLLFAIAIIVTLVVGLMPIIVQTSSQMDLTDALAVINQNGMVAWAISGLTAGQVPYATGANSLAGEATLTYNSGTNTLSTSNLTISNEVNVGGYSPFGILGADGYVISSDASVLVKAFGNFLNWLGWNVSVCDGTADEVEIMDTVDAVPVSGGIVLITPGTFTIDANIEFDNADNNIKLIGTENATIIQDSTYLTRLVYIHDTFGITLSSIRFHKVNASGGAVGTDGQIIFTDTASSITLEDCVIEGSVVTDLPWQSTPTWGAIFTDGGNNIVVRNNHFSNCNYEGAALWDDITNSIIIGNRAIDCGFGFGTEKEGNHSNSIVNNTVTKGRLVQASIGDIFIIDSWGNTITGNTIEGAIGTQRPGITIEGDSFANVISSNTISDATRQGVFVTSYAYNNTIIGNNLLRCVGGIKAYRSSKNTIIGNTITYDKSYGISLDISPLNSIIGNTISYAAYSGIYVFQSKDVVVSNNQIIGSASSSSAEASITIATSTFSKVSGNYIKDMFADVSDTLDANAAIGATTIQVATPSSLSIGQKIAITTGANVDNVTITDSYPLTYETGTPVRLTITPALSYAHSSGDVITGIQVTYQGVYTNSQGTTIVDNYIEGVKQYGVYNYYAPDNVVRGNTIKTVGYNGISIIGSTSTNITIEQNWIDGGSSAGMDSGISIIDEGVAPSWILIRNNRVSGNTDLQDIRLNVGNNIRLEGNQYNDINTGTATGVLLFRGHQELFLDVLAVSATGIRSNEDLSEAIPNTYTIDTQPDIPRTLSGHFDSHAQITAYSVTITGLSARGYGITETFTQANGWDWETNNAFGTITSIIMTARTGTGVGDTMDIGITDVLGLSNKIYDTSDVKKIKKNNANATVATAQVNTTYCTYDMSVIGLAASDNFTIWYRERLDLYGW